MTGAALVLPGRHVGGAALARAVREFGVSVVAGVPTVFLDFVAAFRADPRPFPSLKSVVIGGAACPPSLARALREEVGVGKVNHVYGMTGEKEKKEKSFFFPTQQPLLTFFNLLLPSL